MLALRFSEGQSVIIGDATVKVFEIKGHTAKLAIDAPRHVQIVRANAKRKSRRAGPLAEAIDLIHAAESHRQAVTIAGNRLAQILGAQGQSETDTAFSLIDGAFSPEQSIRLLQNHPKFAGGVAS